MAPQQRPGGLPAITVAPQARALVVAVDHFARTDPGDEELPAGQPGGWPALEFAPARAREVVEVLRDLGHHLLEADVVRNPKFARLRETIEEAALAGPPGGLVIHLLSHGFLGKNSEALYIAAADSTGPDTRKALTVDDLVKRVEDSLTAPPLLLLLDVCHAGAAVEAQWAAWSARLAEQGRRAWIIGATAATTSAFAGRFSVSAATVLRRLHEGLLPVDPSREYVPLGYLSQEMRRELSRLSQAEDGYPQHLMTTPRSDQDEPAVPFFRNPRYTSDAATRYRLTREDGLRNFLAELDPVLDPEHYLGRALGRPQPSTPHTAGGLGEESLFSGRQSELVELASWMDDELGITALRVVTGRPGAGKSALLGVLVCAAHPKLLEIAPQVRRGVDERYLPRRNTRLAAVHLRGRNLREVVESIARQFELAPLADHGWTAATLIEAIRQQLPGKPIPIVVLDALDEATAPDDLIHLLLLELARVRSDNRPGVPEPVCRLLVGTRPWPEFAPLFEAGVVCDLDDVPPERLREELSSYVYALLSTSMAFDSTSGRAARERLAMGVSQALTEPNTDPAAAGPFLVAGLYTHHLLTTGAALAQSDPEQIVARVPRTLAAVLELHLAQMATDGWLRPVLVALASAKEQGLPPRLIGSVAAQFHSAVDGDEVSEQWRVEAVLKKVQFYLRQSVGGDGVTHYRLFHQALADHLRRYPFTPPEGSQ